MPSTNVIMPVLGMNQETGKLLRWLAAPGQAVKKGDILMEVETDKAVAEIEAPADGVLAQVTAQEGDDVPVGRVIAVIIPSNEDSKGLKDGQPYPRPAAAPAQTHAVPEPRPPRSAPIPAQPAPLLASPLAMRIAAENGLDLAQIKPQGGRVEKADVLAYLQQRPASTPARPLASPKARRLAAERGLDLHALAGSGPQGAVLAGDVPTTVGAGLGQEHQSLAGEETRPYLAGEETSISSAWRIMAERTAATWTVAPHFYLMREVDAGQLIAWRTAAQPDHAAKLTYTDLLVKLCAEALRRHPNLNVTFQDGKLLRLDGIHIGLAAAAGDALVVPVIHHAGQLTLGEIALERAALLERARQGRLRPDDVAGGSFTISNLGMYGVDAFNAVLNGSQAAILAVGRIAERVVAVNGQPAVRPTMILSLSCDHRAVDGAHAAQFLDTLAGLIEAPVKLIK